MAQILENDEVLSQIHHEKIEKSSKQFANTKVTSCSSVLMSNGLAVAIPFRTSTQPKEVKQKQEKIISLAQ
jgi:hypothetical protein